MNEYLLEVLPPAAVAAWVRLLPPVEEVDTRPLFGPAMFIGEEYAA